MNLDATVQDQNVKVLTVGQLDIDSTNRSVLLNEHEVVLTTAEFDLLWCLAQRAGEVVSRDELYQALLGCEWDGLDRCIDLRVSRLRRKLRDDARCPRLVKSVRAEGYMLAVEGE